jgi:hypothetical protein
LGQKRPVPQKIAFIGAKSGLPRGNFPLVSQRTNRHMNKIRPIINNQGGNALMKVFALKKLLSKFKAHITTCVIPGKTFIWLPFIGGISAFAVILPKFHGKL